MSLDWSAFNHLNVLVVGDVMIDRYLIGTADRLSPEAPVPVVQLQRQESRLGGAANVALNIQAMGSTPFLCTVTGDDAAGREFLELIRAQGMETSYTLASQQRTTTTKTRIVAGMQQLLRVDQEIVHDLSDEEEEALISLFCSILEKQTIEVVVLQDYNKGVLTARVIEALIREARHRSIPIAVDPKSRNFWMYRHVDLFKPNLKEIRMQYPRVLDATLDSLMVAAGYIREKIQNKYVMITLSEKGIFIEKDGKGQILPTQARKIADVSGAGDTVISVAALCLAMGLPAMEMAAIANLAGGQVCEKPGVAPVNREELEAAWHQLKALLS